MKAYFNLKYQTKSHYYQQYAYDYGDFESFEKAKEAFFSLLSEVQSSNKNKLEEIDPIENIEITGLLIDDLFCTVEKIPLLHINTYIINKDEYYLDEIPILKKLTLKDIVEMKKSSLSKGKKELLNLLILVDKQAEKKLKRREKC